MLDNYFGLIKRSFTNSFKKEEYKNYWKIPSSERLVKVGFPAGAFTFVLCIIVTFIDNFILAMSAVVLISFFVEIPLLQLQIEKLKKKYSK